MKRTALAILLAMFATTAQAKIYRWVDQNGSVHFSDKPSAENAREIEIRETGIELEKPADAGAQAQPETPPLAPENPGGAATPSTTDSGKAVEAEPADGQVITEADYQITTSITTLGEDLVSISGRVGSGPKCYDLEVVATAVNDNGLSVRIRDRVRKSGSFGSVTFKGTAKATGEATGEADNPGAWQVDGVEVRCNDTE